MIGRSAADLSPGFVDPVLDAQGSFRAILDAMARPGTIHRPAKLPPAAGPLGPAAAAVCLTLMDLDTPVWLDGAAQPAAAYLGFHCGSPVVADPAAASFAVIADARSVGPLDRFAIGEADYPDRSATLIVQVAALAASGGYRLSGPGIASQARLLVDGLDPAFAGQWQSNTARYPLGVDVIFAAADTVAALPRTTRLEE